MGAANISFMNRAQVFLFGEERVATWGAIKFMKALDKMERTASSLNDIRKAYDEKVEAYEKIKEVLKGFSSKKTTHTKKLLDYKWTALYFRAGNQSKNRAHDIQELKLECWKKEQKLYTDEEKEVNASDLKQLAELEKYPEFVQLLLNDGQLKKDFFKWAIRDRAPVDVFVQYPDVASRLKSCYIAARVGRIVNKTLKIGEWGGKKDVRLLFESYKWVTVLDETAKVTLKGDFTMSIRQVFRSFELKNYQSGPVEFFQNGIENFDTRRFGSYAKKEKVFGLFGTGRKFKKMDLDGKWWEKLPVIETLTREQLENRLGAKINDSDDGVYMVRATVETEKFDVRKTHAFMGMAIKGRDGTFKLYDFGKSPKYFPRGLPGGLWLLTNTVDAEVEYNDTNNFFSQRQHGTYFKGCSATEIERAMEAIGDEICLARKGHLVFQLCWKNCAHWADQIGVKAFGKEYKEKFKTYFSNLEPEDALLRGAIRLVDTLGKTSRIFWFTITLCLCSWRFRVVRDGQGDKRLESVARTPFAYSTKNKDGKYDLWTYSTGQLVKDIREKQIPGILYSGNGNLFARTYAP